MVTATKAADGNYSQASSVPTPVTLALAVSTTIVVDNSSSIVTGNTLAYTATVNAPTGVATIPAGTVAWAVTGAAVCTTSTTTLSSGVATCSIASAQAGTAYSATATYTQTDNRFTDSSGSDTTAVVGHAPPTTPTITNVPSSGIFGGGFTATVNTNGDGTKSVATTTPTVCATNGLAVTYVGVGTCSDLRPGDGRQQLPRGILAPPRPSRSGGPMPPRPPSPTSLRPPMSSSASRPMWARPATARPRSPPARRRCAASTATVSRSRSSDSGPAR